MISEDQCASYVEKFRQSLISDRRSPRTIKEYCFLYGNFLKFVKKAPEECTKKDVEQFKFYLATEKSYSKASQYLSIQAVKSALKSLEIPIPSNLTPPRRSRKVPNFLSAKEAVAIMQSSSDNISTATIISLLLHSGMRVSELCNLKTEDINFDECSMVIRGGKGDKERIVLVPVDVIDRMKLYHNETITKGLISDYFFVSRKKGRFDTSTIERIVRHSAQKAGIHRKITPHTLRHTFATNILRNGGDIRFIQTLLGHSSISTTEIYTHIDNDALREMFRKHGPKY